MRRALRGLSVGVACAGIVSIVACRPAFRVLDDAGTVATSDGGYGGDGGAGADAAAHAAPPSEHAGVSSDAGVHARVDAATPRAEARATTPLDGPSGVTFPDGAGREVERLGPAFRGCYTRALAHDATAGGAPVITVVVRQDGTVTKATVRPGGLRGEVAECLKAKLEAATFDPVIGDERTLTFQVSFVPPRTTPR